MNEFGWRAFEDALYDTLRGAIVTLARAHPDARWYAVVLHSVYRELDGPLSLPALAAAHEEGSPPADDSGFWGLRFSPADFPFPELELELERANALERALTDEANRDSQEHWYATESKYFEVLEAVTMRLRDDVPRVLDVTDDFVCFWHDEEGGPDRAAQSIPSILFERLFPNEARAVRVPAAATLDEPSAGHVTRWIAELDAPEKRWTAARALGQSGVASPAVIDSLRRHSGELWCAKALGLLGDFDWLATQAADTAALGFAARFLDVATGGTPPPLDYRRLERYLDRASQGARAAVETQLEPGRSYIEILPEDVDEALRGLVSPHAVVRWHAAAVLDDRGLGAAIGKKVLPALAERLADPHPIVRRLALLSIGRWKAAAKPYRAAIVPLRQDPDAVVARIATEMLGD